MADAVSNYEHARPATESETPDAASEFVVIPRSELAKLLVQNEHQSKQIKELQQHSTLRLEQLRVFRRLKLTDEQSVELKSNMDALYNDILKSNAPKDRRMNKTKTGDANG